MYVCSLRLHCLCAFARLLHLLLRTCSFVSVAVPLALALRASSTARALRGRVCEAGGLEHGLRVCPGCFLGGAWWEAKMTLNTNGNNG